MKGGAGCCDRSGGLRTQRTERGLGALSVPRSPGRGLNLKPATAPQRERCRDRAEAARPESKASCENQGLRAAQDPEGQDITGRYLGDNELRILRTVQLQLLGDIGQGDARIGEADHTDTCAGGRRVEPPGPGSPAPAKPTAPATTGSPNTTAAVSYLS